MLPRIGSAPETRFYFEQIRVAYFEGTERWRLLWNPFEADFTPAGRD